MSPQNVAALSREEKVKQAMMRSTAYISVQQGGPIRGQVLGVIVVNGQVMTVTLDYGPAPALPAQKTSGHTIPRRHRSGKIPHPPLRQIPVHCRKLQFDENRSTGQRRRRTLMEA